MARILLTGARGMLGRRLWETLSSSHEVLATGRKQAPFLRLLDISRPAEVALALKEIRPDWIVNAAAYTQVDRAEDEPEQAFRANSLGPDILARAAAAARVRLLHISSDFVFDGRKPGPYLESDPTGALGVYGQSKEEGEQKVLQASRRHVIVRLAWLFGSGGANFVDTILGRARQGDPLRVVADQVGSPTSTRDAARGIKALLEADFCGIVHACNRGSTSWFGLALAAVRAAGLCPRVEPIPASAYPALAPRPANSRLENRVLAETVGDFMRPWEEALKEHIKECCS